MTALKPSDFVSGLHPVWCPGCGDYGVLAALEEALARFGRPSHEVALISGIGCSSRLPAYTKCYGFHGVHGRALPVATGLKVSRPDLTVIAVGGDGDGYSIGGNHFVHACRRDLNLTYVVMDNRVYGMTKGQPSPTTEVDWESELSSGTAEAPPLDPIALAIAAGATFIARGFSSELQQLTEIMLEALRWPGFAYVEVLSPCIVFRPEEFEWKERVRLQKEPIIDDRAAAFAAITADDGYSTGVLFKTHRRVPKERGVKPLKIASIESEFALSLGDQNE